jgi:hypothetical protein
MSRRCIAVLALLTASAWLLAQDTPDVKKPPEAPTKVRGYLPKYFKSLGLSDEQKQTIYKLRASYAAKVDALTEQIRALHKAEAAEIDKLLTDAQKARLKELKLGEQPKAGEGEDKGKPPPKSP